MNNDPDTKYFDLLNKALKVNPDPVLIMTCDGNILYFNPATKKFLELIFPRNNQFPINTILPANIENILVDMKNNSVNTKSVDYELASTFLNCTIIKPYKDDVYNLYITNMTTVKNIAYYDPVTQLPNTIYLNKIVEDEVDKSKKFGSCFCLIKFDVSNYKNLSYALGYQFGEKLLLAVADKLRNIFKDDAVVGKYNDHDYAILLPQVSMKSARVFADTVVEIFENPLIISDLRIEIEVCLGIAEYPRHGNDAHSIFQCADIAMHKSQKINSQVETYDKEYFKETTRKIKLATELHSALATNDLSIVYQPKVNIDNNRVVGVEALMRWTHPKEGNISPEIFIEVAEQSRLIKEITIWVLNKTLKDYSQLAKILPNIQLSVNITAKDLTSDSFPEVVAGLLAAWRIPANVLILEITENALIIDTEQVLSIISRLNNVGVKFSIDDFGTGYSSLNYLKQLNVNELKIDKSFVMDMIENENNRIIVHAVTSLAHDLNLKVTAEGVESESIMSELKNYHCDIAQGYYLSKPLPLNEIIEWIIDYQS
jgi:diguanylate cyclase (GGDEF)-like protein